MRICISHMEDVDGIVSACLISKLFNTNTMLVDYSNFIPTLRELKQKDIQELFICDMGLSLSNQEEFIELIKTLSKNAKITYIDHHDLDPEIKREISLNIRFIHTIEECTSAIIYSQFSDGFNERDRLLVSAAAIVDEMDLSPTVSKLIKRYDRQYLFFETVILSYAIYYSQNDMDFLLRLVDELKHKMPHEISDVIDRAVEFSKLVTSTFYLLESVNVNKGFGYTYAKEQLSSGIVANMLLRMKELNVALAYKEKDDGYVVSLRGSQDYDKHLGRIVNSLAYELGGSGGGHRLASGAFIPKDRFSEFIDRLEKLI